MQGRRNVIVRVKSSSGAWQALGSDLVGSGIIPENVQLVADTYGSKTASFDLRREVIFTWPDLQAFNPVEVEIDGVVVWSGRIAETPARLDPDDRVISVQAEGWQYHMDDDPYWKRYVHTKLADWRDTRTFPDVSLPSWTASGIANADTGKVTLGFPNGASWATGVAVGIILDLGPQNVAKRIVIKGYRTAGAPGSVQIYARTADAAGHVHPASGSYSDGVGPLALSAASTSESSPSVYAGTFSSPQRFVSVFLYNSGATYTVTAADNNGDVFIITSIQVFTDTAYESGNASILKASDVLKDGLSHAPMLSSDTSGITATSFSIPDFSPDQYQTFREYAQAANTFHNYTLMVDPRKRVIFGPKSTTPRLEVGEWSGYTFEDASANSGADLYNKVIVQGTGPDGSPLTSASTTSSSLITRQGFTRTKVLSVDAALTSTTAQQIGDTYLASHRDVAFKGTIMVSGTQALRDAVSGIDVPPERALLYVNALVRLGDMIDPNTGALGRLGRIAEVTYDVDEDLATIALDNTRANFEALLARYAVVVGARVQG